MNPDHLAALERQIAERHGAFGRTLTQFWKVCHLELHRIESLNQNDSAVYLGVTTQTRERYGLQGDEILSFVLTAREQLQWFIPAARERLKREVRTDPGVCLLFSPDPNIKQKARGIAADEHGRLVSFIALSTKDLERSLPSQCALLFDREFQGQAFAVDHFAETSPVSGDALFGRHQLVAQLEREIIAGHPVGIFGLRRVGKTSVLQALIAQLRTHTSPSMVVALADLQRNNYALTAERVARSLTSPLLAFAESLGSRIRDDAKDFDLLTVAIRHLVNKRFRVTLALDEVEWLIPHEDTASKRRLYLDVFGQLRGIKQEFGSELGIVVCGINQSLAELPTIGAYPNPVLDFFHPHYVTGLSRKSHEEMLRKLGGRMGLGFGDDALHFLYEHFNGHPYFSRQLCSAVASTYAKRPNRVKTEDLKSAYPRFVAKKHGVLEQVLQHLEYFYPGEYTQLVSLAVSGRFDDVVDARHLVDYGLVALRGQVPILAMACFEHYLKQSRGARSSASGPWGERFELGPTLGTGATSTVYKVRDKALGESRAIKVFVPEHSVLAREEYAILRAVRSPWVVQAFDLIQTTDNKACIVLEFVDGAPLDVVLKRRRPLDQESLGHLAENLFAAVDSIHPPSARLQELQQNAEISDDDFAEYIAIKDAGVLHRDLKPENMIVTDELSWKIKLVDMGLAKRAGSAGRTNVGTPAYMPPDVGVARWDVTFDLYAVGVILFEAIFGSLPPSNIASVNAVVRGDRRLDWLKATAFFRKALAPSSSERYQAPGDMRRAWAGVLYRRGRGAGPKSG